MCDNLTDQLSKLNVSNTQEEEEFHLTEIVDSINDKAQLGYDSLVYEIITLKDDSIKRISQDIIKLFPEISIKIIDKRLYIDWS